MKQRRKTIFSFIINSILYISCFYKSSNPLLQIYFVKLRLISQKEKTKLFIIEIKYRVSDGSMKGNSLNLDAV